MRLLIFPWTQHQPSHVLRLLSTVPGGHSGTLAADGVLGFWVLLLPEGSGRYRREGGGGSSAVSRNSWSDGKNYAAFPPLTVTSYQRFDGHPLCLLFLESGSRGKRCVGSPASGSSTPPDYPSPRSPQRAPPFLLPAAPPTGYVRLQLLHSASRREKSWVSSPLGWNTAPMFAPELLIYIHIEEPLQFLTSLPRILYIKPQNICKYNTKQKRVVM